MHVVKTVKGWLFGGIIPDKEKKYILKVFLTIYF